jgi:ferrous iron transport protein A
MTTLDSLDLRSPARVKGFVDGALHSVSLMELGIVPGTRIEVIRSAPLGDPLEIDVTGARLALRRSVAASIIVAKD